MAGYVLGIDGGGSRTRAMIMGTDGKVCGIAESGSSNYDDLGIEQARENLAKAVLIAQRQAGLPVEPFAAAFLGIGGVASATDRMIIKQIALELGLAPEQKIGVDHDLRIALAGGLSGRHGIVLIAGTGSSCYGRNEDGESWRSGGWGPLIADEGSGYWLGIQAMKAATRSYDGRSQPTTLAPVVLSYLGLSEMDEIMYRLYAQEMTRAEIGQLAPLVIEAAKANDGTSLRIIQEGSEEMADCVQAVARQLNLLDGCELALSGGVFTAGGIVVDPLLVEVNKRLPLCRVLLAESLPVMGACLLALEHLGIYLPAEKIDRSGKSLSQL